MTDRPSTLQPGELARSKYGVVLRVVGDSPTYIIEAQYQSDSPTEVLHITTDLELARRLYVEVAG